MVATLNTSPPRCLTVNQQERIGQFIRSRLSNVHDAQDITQEAYLRFLSVIQSRVVDNPDAYLFRIAQNLVCDQYVRSSRNVEIQTNNVFVDDSLSVEDLTYIEQKIDILELLLTKMSSKSRAALIMHRRDGMTYDEIATCLGVSSAMVKKYLSTTVAHCKKGFNKYHKKDSKTVTE